MNLGNSLLGLLELGGWKDSWRENRKPCATTF